MNVAGLIKAAGGLRWVTIDRVILVGLLTSQVGLWGWLYRERQADREPRAPAAQPGMTTGQRQPVRVAPPIPNEARMTAMAQLQRQFDRMAAQAFGGFPAGPEWADFDAGWDQLALSPTMEMRETAAGCEVIFSLPGVAPSDINVALQDNLLTVTAASAHRDARGRTQNQNSVTRVQLPGPPEQARDCRTDFTNGILRVLVTGKPTAAGGQANM